MCLIEARHGIHALNRQRVLGQRPGLVSAQDIQGEGGWERNGDRSQDCRQHEWDDLGERHLEKVRIRDEHQDDDAVKDREISYHPQHRLLLGTHDVRCSHEFRSAAELGTRSGRRHFSRRLTPAYQRARKCRNADARFDRDGFTGQHGLVKLDLATRDFDIGGHHATERELHHIPGDELHSRNRLPTTVSLHRGIHGEPRLQGV